MSYGDAKQDICLPCISNIEALNDSVPPSIPKTKHRSDMATLLTDA